MPPRLDSVDTCYARSYDGMAAQPSDARGSGSSPKPSPAEPDLAEPSPGPARIGGPGFYLAEAQALGLSPGFAALIWYNLP
ncbi:hypothetical protein JB92DRAFT_1331514 [Gautieria morchelliformis]|nr:hypothetical protein JB92DRAFT_1331514 [Gautieria morchelliformis]